MSVALREPFRFEALVYDPQTRPLPKKPRPELPNTARPKKGLVVKGNRQERRQPTENGIAIPFERATKVLGLDHKPLSNQNAIG